MRIFVVIKGTLADAEIAAIKHGVSFEFEAVNSKGTETYGHCTAEDRATLIQWYAEDAGFAVKEYPKGSLLWYAYRD